GQESRRKVDVEVVEERYESSGPADRYGCGADRVLENEIPTDDPGDKLAHRGERIGIGAASDGNHGGEFAVAKAGESAADRGENERNGKSWASLSCSGDAGESEDASADDGSNAQSNELIGAKGTLQGALAGFFGFAEQKIEWLGSEQGILHAA